MMMPPKHLTYSYVELLLMMLILIRQENILLKYGGLRLEKRKVQSQLKIDLKFNIKHVYNSMF